MAWMGVRPAAVSTPSLRRNFALQGPAHSTTCPAVPAHHRKQAYHRAAAAPILPAHPTIALAAAPKVSDSLLSTAQERPASNLW